MTASTMTQPPQLRSSPRPQIRFGSAIMSMNAPAKLPIRDIVPNAWRSPDSTPMPERTPNAAMPISRSITPSAMCSHPRILTCLPHFASCEDSCVKSLRAQRAVGFAARLADAPREQQIRPAAAVRIRYDTGRNEAEPAVEVERVPAQPAHGRGEREHRVRVQLTLVPSNAGRIVGGDPEREPAACGGDRFEIIDEHRADALTAMVGADGEGVDLPDAAVIGGLTAD